MNDEEKDIKYPPVNKIETTKENNWSSKKQKIIFSISVNGLILTGAFLNIFYLRFLYLNEKDIQAQLYLSFIFAGINIYNYFKASLTSPSQTDVDKYFNFSVLDKTKGNSIINIDAEKYSLKCEFCNKIKFERSSHCRTCKTCILRRDHHCIWIGNCVGLNNNQYFLNFCIWIGSLYFVYNSFVFFWNYKSIVQKHVLNINFIILSILFIYSCVLVLVYTAVFPIILQQLFFILNDFTYLEKKKKFSLESHYCYKVEKNEFNEFNHYNKGFLNHFFYVIGPTIFHFLFPLPKYNTKYPIIENACLFNKTKQPHPFSVHKYIKDLNMPGIADACNEQLKATDPINFIELSYKNYENKTLI